MLYIAVLLGILTGAFHAYHQDLCFTINAGFYTLAFAIFIHSKDSNLRK